MTRSKDKGKRKTYTKTKVDDLGRVCTNCGEYKPWDCYFTHKQKIHGHQEQCKVCVTSKLRDGREEILREHQRNYQREYKKRDPLRYKAGNIRGSLLRNCTKHGIDRDTTPSIEDIKKWLKDSEPYVCHYSSEKVTLRSMNIDHKQPVSRGGDNKLENLCICSASMNRAKGNMTEEEFVKLLEFIKGFEDGGKGILKRLKQTRF